MFDPLKQNEEKKTEKIMKTSEKKEFFFVCFLFYFSIQAKSLDCYKNVDLLCKNQTNIHAHTHKHTYFHLHILALYSSQSNNHALGWRGRGGGVCAG